MYSARMSTTVAVNVNKPTPDARRNNNKDNEKWPVEMKKRQLTKKNVVFMPVSYPSELTRDLILKRKQTYQWMEATILSKSLTLISIVRA